MTRGSIALKPLSSARPGMRNPTATSPGVVGPSPASPEDVGAQPGGPVGPSPEMAHRSTALGFQPPAGTPGAGPTGVDGREIHPESQVGPPADIRDRSPDHGVGRSLAAPENPVPEATGRIASSARGRGRELVPRPTDARAGVSAARVATASESSGATTAGAQVVRRSLAANARGGTRTDTDGASTARTDLRPSPTPPAGLADPSGGLQTGGERRADGIPAPTGSPAVRRGTNTGGAVVDTAPAGTPTVSGGTTRGGADGDAATAGTPTNRRRADTARPGIVRRAPGPVEVAPVRLRAPGTERTTAPAGVRRHPAAARRDESRSTEAVTGSDGRAPADGDVDSGETARRSSPAPSAAHVAAQRLTVPEPDRPTVRRPARADTSRRTGGARLRSGGTSDLPVRRPVALLASPGTDPSSAGSTGNGSAGNAAAVQRAIVLAGASAAAATAPPPLATSHNGERTVRRFVIPDATSDPAPSLPTAESAPERTDRATATATATAAADPPSTTAVLDRVDEMMAQLEERILEELERRGGRFTGTF
jgi:hypothetical protein